MSDDVVSLNEARAEKAGDNSLWSPLDCVRAIARDIEDGEISPQSIFVIAVKYEGDGEMVISRYRSNLDGVHEVALLAVASSKAVARWIGE